MSGILWVSLGAAVGLLAPLLFRLWQRGGDRSTATARRAPAKPTAGKGRDTARHPVVPKAPVGLNRRQTRKFHGVSIRPGLDACRAVQQLAGQRFLPEEAPVTPLAGCDQSRCQCTYSHHGDRRERDDRRSGWGSFGGFTPSIPNGNRRAKSRDRRAPRDS